MRRADHLSPPCTTRRPMCAPAALSSHISCGAPWCPITTAPLFCCRPSLLQPGCRTRSSATKAHVACPAGRANTAESTPSRPQHSVASMPALPLLPSLRSTPRERMLALPPRQAESSLPSLSPCVGPRCLYAIHSYKRDLPRAFCPRPHCSLPLVSHHRHTAFVFCRCVGAKLPHPTSLPVRRSRSSARPQSCSRTRSNHTFTAVELRRRRPRW
jgi:hypothetical protein